MKLPDVGRNLIPETWTAKKEGALSELSSCPRAVCHDDADSVRETHLFRPAAQKTESYFDSFSNAHNANSSSSSSCPWLTTLRAKYSLAPCYT